MDTNSPPERVARARRLYAEGVLVSTILAETQMTQATLTRCLAGEYDDGSGAAPRPIPLRSASKGKRKRPRATDRAELIEKLWRAAGKQVDEIEARLAAVGLEVSEREGNARTFAIVVKTLRELKALDAQRTSQEVKRERQAQDADNDDDPVPRDIDEFRRELANRIRKLVEARTGSGVSGEHES